MKSVSPASSRRVWSQARQRLLTTMGFIKRRRRTRTGPGWPSPRQCWASGPTWGAAIRCPPREQRVLHFLRGPEAREINISTQINSVVRYTSLILHSNLHIYKTYILFSSFCYKDSIGYEECQEFRIQLFLLTAI